MYFFSFRSALRKHWVHPEAQPLTVRSVSSCI